MCAFSELQLTCSAATTCQARRKACSLPASCQRRATLRSCSRQRTQLQLGKLLAKLSLPWDNCRKELFWRLTVDGKPMMAREQERVAAAPVVWWALGPCTTTGSAQLHRE